MKRFYLLLIFLSTITVKCMENNNPIVLFIPEIFDEVRQYVCFNLSEDDHMDSLIHFSKNNNEQGISYIIENENETNKKNRRSILYEFGYVNLLCDFTDIHFLNVENNMRAYTAMRREDDAPNMHFFYSKAYVGSLSLIKIFAKNVNPKEVKFGKHILFWPTLNGDERFAKFLLDSGMSFDHEVLDGLVILAERQNHNTIAQMLKEKRDKISKY